MIFVDASAIVAIIGEEDDWQSFAERVDSASKVISSPMALWESAIALGRTGQSRSFDEAVALVESFVEAFEVEIIPITVEIGALAIDASRRFGRGRHPASLNFGDCFAYACALSRNTPLLFKGDDFPLTDITAA